jgi:hypothetical protein
MQRPPARSGPRAAHLQVAAQLLGRLAQRSSDLLDLFLVVVELALVGESFERCSLRDEVLVAGLQPALLLDDSRDLIADDLRELVAVRHHIRRDRREEGELFQRLLHHRRDARRLDDRQRHGCRRWRNKGLATTTCEGRISLFGR